jgi:putative FmdB family regulatory protein
MPLYEYKCHTCGKTFEKMQKFSDAPLLVHDGCGGELEKLISTSALKFKGSGWYVNDYGRGGHLPQKDRSNGESSKTEAKSDSKPASGNGNKTAAKSDPPPAAKADSKPSEKPAPSR